ncbi:hypothetical protein GCM10029963_77390 [Micromonospora andamanensis]|nr:hypothetical protein Vwe01_35890 [Micromonospora andamanensis]
MVTEPPHANGFCHQHSLNHPRRASGTPDGVSSNTVNVVGQGTRQAATWADCRQPRYEEIDPNQGSRVPIGGPPTPLPSTPAPATTSPVNPPPTVPADSPPTVAVNPPPTMPTDPN